ncbi:MAG: glycosyltransferase [Sphingomonas sp.]|nr:glycosyltransferase [Sphingomonas sp.]
MASLAVDAIRRGHDVAVVYSPDRADPQILDTLRNGGVTRLEDSPMRRSIGPWDALDGLRLRTTIAALGHFDVIHSHSSKAGALARGFAHIGGAAHVYSPHGFYTMTGAAPFYIGPVERALSWFGDRVIAVSNYEGRHAIDLGIAADKVVVVPNGIAPYDPRPRTEARAALGLNTDAFAVGFVGRLAAQKNPLEAVAAIDATSSGAVLAVLGDGELRAAAEDAARTCNANAVFAGQRDAKPLFSAFDCLLCTSRYEGMAVSFLEALNCGVPIVSYPVGGTEELVIDGETGFVIEPQPYAAAAAIDGLAAASSPHRIRMAQACRALAAKHTDAEMGRQTLEVYESVLKWGA